MKKHYILYHGSREAIEKPIFGKGKPYNDYGKGFYCTESVELAKEWACTEKDDGFVNKYELDAVGLSVLCLSGSGYTILNWLALLLANRTFTLSNPLAAQAKEYLLKEFSVAASDADIIIGYRADDSYFSFAEDFLNNTISLSQLEHAMFLGKLGEQVVLMSKKAFEHITYKGNEKVERAIYFPKRAFRDTEARKDYLRTDKTSVQNAVNGLYVLDILRGGIKNDDARIQRIVSR
ncbi:MAG: DUF3990 domain-containing protein [Clostridiales bacterium]|jgi:hypothetical protein|nr:DUF3990 domain-containing protein [Clostridiales bacterium]